MKPAKKKVFILRGISGSGKSKQARKIIVEELKLSGNNKNISLETFNSNPSITYCSADKYFMKEGEYIYDYSKIDDAHDACLKEYLEALSDPINQMIVVDNTHTESWEYAPYTALARIFEYDITIVEVHRDIMACIRENVHQVPANIIKAQYKRFQKTPTKFNVQIVKIGKLPNRLTRLYRWLFRVI